MRRLAPDALDLLTRQPWRGNVRELKNLVYRAALLAREETIEAAGVAGLLERAAPSGEGAPQDLAGAIRGWVDAERPPDASMGERGRAREHGSRGSRGPTSLTWR